VTTIRAIILAGGRGTRLAEETDFIPKPMVLISGQPVLWHIMNIYAKQGITNFVIATGYLSEVIEEWVESTNWGSWNVETLYTGLDSGTGGRLRRCMLAFEDEVFLATYGDGLANVDISSLIRLHAEGNFLATLTAVRPPARFGVVQINDSCVVSFGEKNQADSGWINGGFFVLMKEVANYISGDFEAFELGALPRLARDGRLGGYNHYGFWKPMDTLREKMDLENLATRPQIPWLDFGFQGRN
jgi:glucose-1-phosphate cytidylyltransferase